MSFKLFAGLLGLAMAVVFLLPPILKTKEISLVVIVLIGIGTVAYEFYETVRGKED
ncbi:MAG TPA: hypothetical protein PK725_15005 [Rhodocyclaceae bacterium]|jgi:hypothetical protein|nr:hypothetical protein [Rhodocyclaceae bacterium]HRQ48261.1 hypothetical protein [Rhodocyclaceae bacterium]